MKPFRYVRPGEQQEAIDLLVNEPNAKLIAGGTNLLDLMKKGVTNPDIIIDLKKLPLREIVQTDGSIRIGAMALNSEVAEHKLVKEKYPLLAQAIKAGASAQLRNMATIAGNIMQRTRCYYFYDTSLPCNKREPGTGCSALQGFNRIHAIFGASEKCIAVNPSDLSIALAALDASVHVIGPEGERTIKIENFHRLPGDTPEKDTVLEKDELIVAVSVPDPSFNKNVHYLKVRDRASYAFALVSVAAALSIQNNNIQDARLVMGGVAHKPWRLTSAENVLRDNPVSEEVFNEAAKAAVQGAKVYQYNVFKEKLAFTSVIKALRIAAGLH